MSWQPRLSRRRLVNWCSRSLALAPTRHSAFSGLSFFSSFQQSDHLFDFVSYSSSSLSHWPVGPDCKVVPLLLSCLNLPCWHQHEKETKCGIKRSPSVTDQGGHCMCRRLASFPQFSQSTDLSTFDVPLCVPANVQKKSRIRTTSSNAPPINVHSNR